MGSKWQNILLGDLINQGQATLQTGPFGTALKADEYTKIGVPLISVREIRDGFIQIEESTPRIDEKVIERLPKFVLKEGDIVFARKGGVDRTAYISKKQAGWFIGSDGIYLRVSDEYNALFFSYILRSTQVKDWLLKNCEGTTMPSLNQKILSRIPLTIPKLSEQNKIAEFLLEFDQKITLNRQINQTLEQMAQTLFKSWFVDFDPVIDNALDAGNEIPEPLQTRAELRQKVRASQDFQPLPSDVRALFPAEFEESELGWVPKGWKASNVGNEFDVTMGQSPPGDTYNENGIGFPFFQGKTDFGFRFPSNRVYCTDPKRLANKNDTLISVRAPVGDTNLAASDCCIGRGVAAVRHKSGSVSFTYYAINNLAKHFEVYEGEGTVFGSINQKDMNSLPQLAVPKDCIFFFDKYAGDWDKKIELAAKEIEQLTQLRDTLLPKLISGELRLDDLPDEVVTAANE